MKRVLYNCDLCGKEIKKAHYVSIGNMSLKDWEKEVCKECAEKCKKYIEEYFMLDKIVEIKETRSITKKDILIMFAEIIKKQSKHLYDSGLSYRISPDGTNYYFDKMIDETVKSITSESSYSDPSDSRQS